MPERSYPLPADEHARLQALLELQILDTPAEEAFDDLTRLAALICETPIALVSLIDDQRQWFKSRVGLDARETPREQAFCTHAILGSEIFEVPDPQVDPRFRDNPLVTGAPHIRFYAGMPVSSPDGQRIGTLCVIDRQPRLLSPAQRQALQYLGQIASRQLVLRRQAILQAREAALQRALLNSAGCALLCTDHQGLLTYLNPTAEQLLGQSAKALHGQSLCQLLDPRELQARALLLGLQQHSPAPNGFAVLSAELAEHDTSSHEWTLQRSDGAELPVLLTLSPIRNDQQLMGYLAILQDMSQRQLFQQRLQRIAEQVPGMLFQFIRQDAQHFYFPYASEGIRPIFGISPQQAAQESHLLFERIDSEDLPRVRASVDRSAAELSPWHQEFRVRPTPDSLLWVEARSMPQALREGGVQWHGFITDISERKRIEHLKAEFVSTVSHELRTPLTAIAGALGLVVNGALGEVPASMREMLRIAEQNSQRLTLLINDLLDMEKLSAGKMVFQLRRQPLLPLLEEALDSNRAYAERFAVTLQLTGDCTAQVRVDRLRLQQVLANLLSNAAKFTAPGSTVEVQATQSVGQVRVSVIDKGPGIPQEFQAHLFHKFAQADATDSRSSQGTGLGLAISKELIERMDGTIGFTSSSQGSTFWFSLPLADTTPPAAPDSD